MDETCDRPLRWPSLKRLLIQINVDLDSLSKAVTPATYDNFTVFHQMVLVLEDRRYFKHMGVDYRSFIRDGWRFLTFRSHGGFSTIEMQFVRTVTGRYHRSFGRKVYEILLAHLCNWHFTKFDLLNSYLNIAYFGTRYPVQWYYEETSNYEAVAQDVFFSSADSLTLEEAAELA